MKIELNETEVCLLKNMLINSIWEVAQRAENAPMSFDSEAMNQYISRLNTIVNGYRKLRHRIVDIERGDMK